MLSVAIKPRVVDRDRRLGADPLHQLFMLFLEAARLGVAEKQASDDLAGSPSNRHREIAYDRQVPLGHAVVRVVLAVTRVLCDVIGSHDSFTAEGRREDLRVARHREVFERRARHAGDGVEHVALAGRVDDIVEERSEVGACQLDTRVGDHLNHTLEVQLTGNRGAGAVQRLKVMGFFLERLFSELSIRDVDACA